MNASVIVGLAIASLSGIALCAGLASGNMPSVFRSVDDADRDVTPLAFRVLAVIYLSPTCFGAVLAAIGWAR